MLRYFTFHYLWSTQFVLFCMSWRGAEEQPRWPPGATWSHRPRGAALSCSATWSSTQLFSHVEQHSAVQPYHWVNRAETVSRDLSDFHRNLELLKSVLSLVLWAWRGKCFMQNRFYKLQVGQAPSLDEAWNFSKFWWCQLLSEIIIITWAHVLNPLKIGSYANLHAWN